MREKIWKKDDDDDGNVDDENDEDDDSKRRLVSVEGMKHARNVLKLILMI